MAVKMFQVAAQVSLEPERFPTEYLYVERTYDFDLINQFNLKDFHESILVIMQKSFKEKFEGIQNIQLARIGRKEIKLSVNFLEGGKNKIINITLTKMSQINTYDLNMLFDYIEEDCRNAKELKNQFKEIVYLRIVTLDDQDLTAEKF